MLLKEPFEDYTNNESFSRGMAVDILRSPQHFYKKWITKEIPSDFSRDLDIGILLHRVLLEPETILPYLKVQPDFGDQRKTENKKALLEWKQTINPVDVIVSIDDKLMIDKTLDAYEKCPEAQSYFTGGQAEISDYRVVDDITLKARYDYLKDSHIIDFKTTADGSPSAFAESINKYQYDIQAAFYMYVRVTYEFTFVCLEKKSYEFSFYRLSKDRIQKAYDLVMRAIETYQKCRYSGEWPGYSKIPIEL